MLLTHSHCRHPWRSLALEVCPFSGKLTSRWFLRYDYFPRCLLDVWQLTDLAVPNGGLSALTADSSHRPVLFLILTPRPPISERVARFQGGVHFSVLLSGLTASASWPLSFLSLESVTRPVCLPKLSGMQIRFSECGAPLNFLFPGLPRERSLPHCHCGGGIENAQHTSGFLQRTPLFWPFPFKSLYILVIGLRVARLEKWIWENFRIWK